MSDYRVKGTDLTAVADAIRTKGGTSASLSFPDGFVSAVQNIPSGGGSTLISKTITANGTYDASDDSADGYSEVTVNISSKLVSGTFTGETEGSGMTITIPYAGNGHPVALVIYPTVGANKSGETITNLARRLAIISYSAIKNEAENTPTYNDNSLTTNKASVYALFKNSSSSASDTTSNRDTDCVFYTSYPVNNGLNAIVRFASATSMKVYIMAANDSGYGFVKDVEYTYQIIYSS